MAANTSTAFINGLRWICVLPGAVLAGFLASVVVKFVNSLTLSWAVADPDSFLVRVFLEIVSGIALGGGGVIAGVKIAPNHKTPTVFVLAFTFVLLSGFLLFPALAQRNWWAILNVAALVVGAAGVAWSVYSGETDVEDAPDNESAS